MWGNGLNNIFAQITSYLMKISYKVNRKSVESFIPTFSFTRYK